MKNKILVDRILGLPLVYLLNAMARLLGFFLRIDHDLQRPCKTIAISKFVGMGSIVQSVALLKTLRKNFPHARIIFITKESNRALFACIPEVDEVFGIADSDLMSLLISNVKILFRLWKNKPDVYIDLEIHSNYSSILSTLSMSRNRMGFFKDDKTYRKGIYTHMLFFNMKSAISETYLQFARLLSCKEIISEIYLPLSDARISDALAIFRKSGLPEIVGPYILINANASDLRLERRWPEARVVELVKLLTADFPNYSMVLMGDKQEMKYIHGISKQLAAYPQVIDASGKWSLSELMVCIQNAALLLTNDTGPMHLAFALKAPVVSLFGPCSPQQYGGREKSIAIYKNVYCSPCVHDFLIPPCQGDNQCMKKIQVEEVRQAVHKGLQADFNVYSNDMQYLSDSSQALGVISRSK